MTKLLDKIRGGGGIRELPTQLNRMSAQAKSKALGERRERIRALATSKHATPAARNEALREIRAMAVDVKRLEAAGARSDVPPLTAEEKALEAGRRNYLTRSLSERTKAEQAVRVLIDNHLLSSELGRIQLHAENISDDEGVELIDLLDGRYLRGEEWGQARQARFRELVVKLAGFDCFEAVELAEGIRLDALPKRPRWEEPQSVTIPALAAYRWFKSSKPGGWTLADVGGLAVLLAMFESRDSFAVVGGRFREDEDGEPVLVVKGKFRWNARLNPAERGVVASRGHVEDDVLDHLARNNWFDVSRAGGDVEIRLGERARRLRRGRST
jgi:hypothetical protein